jgi:hypothetical protein
MYDNQREDFNVLTYLGRAFGTMLGKPRLKWCCRLQLNNSRACDDVMLIETTACYSCGWKMRGDFMWICKLCKAPAR